MRRCLAVFPLFTAALLTADTKPVTFNKDVAPILFRSCVGCHRPGDVAPMSLLSYKEARPWAKAIQEAVVSRKMPPWHADPHFGTFSNDPSLKPQEVDTIRAWVTAGAPEGDAKDLPAVPAFVGGWRIGKPDMVFEIPEEVTLSAAGPDEYKYFKVATNFTEDMWVQAVELRAGNRKIVHHAHVFIEIPQKDEGAKDAKTGAPQKSIFVHVGNRSHIDPATPVVNDGCSMPDGGYVPGKKPGNMSGLLGSYVPGKWPETWPDGVAKKVPAGSVLSFQIHYSRTTGKEEKDRTAVGVIFAKQPPKKELRRMDISSYFFAIPAGAASSEVTACQTFPVDAQLISYLAHMHFRGKDMKFEAFYPDGRTETLLNVPNYNFEWQTMYRLAQPVAIPKGTRIKITAHFDNSANNRYNPDPTTTVRWGDQTIEEMMDGWIEYVEASPDAPKISKAVRVPF
jgi:hypothetical protein